MTFQEYLKEDTKPTIEEVEDKGEEVDKYPVDKSQTESNAGDAIVYKYNNKKYEVITWKDGKKKISELTDEE